MKFKAEVPVVHTFDVRYVVPAAVSFLSMLENSSPDIFYRIHVLHSGLPDCDIGMLESVVARFENATVEFHDVSDLIPRLHRLFEGLVASGRRHYAKEMFLKLMLPDLFPSYGRIIVSDVDVVWKGDVATGFLDWNEDEEYIAGINSRLCRCAWSDAQDDANLSPFSPKEREAIRNGVGAGYLFLNCDAMRRNGMVEKLTDFVASNLSRLRNPEQDTFNIVCEGHIGMLPNRMMVCTYLYERCTKQEMNINAPIIADPVQIHYASQTKPWNTPSCCLSEEWYKVLLRTPVFKRAMHRFDPPMKKKKSWLQTSFGLPVVRVKSKPLRDAEYKLFGLFKLH